jgi:hypothetical protein
MHSGENFDCSFAACSARSILFCSVRFNIRHHVSLTFPQSERRLKSLEAFLKRPLLQSTEENTRQVAGLRWRHAVPAGRGVPG